MSTPEGRTMDRRRRLFVLLVAAWVASPAYAYVIPPEPLLDLGGGIEVVAGSWRATGTQWNTGRGPATLVQLCLRAGRRGDIRHSFARLVTDLPGLGPDAVLGGSQGVRFQLVRDAGTLHFEGTFSAGAGAGNFIFIPSAPYLSAMHAFGYQGIDAEKAYTMAALDVTRTFVGELAALGYASLSVDQLLALRTHGADGAFVRAMRAEGYDRLTADELVALRINGVGPELVADLKRLGYGRLPTEQLVSFRRQGVTPDFIRELRGLGYRCLSGDDLISLRRHDVTPEFVKRVNLNRRATTPVTRLVDIRTHGREP